VDGALAARTSVMGRDESGAVSSVDVPRFELSLGIGVGWRTRR
jgi:hypothetical protein